jgi:hypothetical protein
MVPMREPSLRHSRLLISAGLVAAITLSSAGFFVGRSTSPRAAPSAQIFTTPPVMTEDPVEIKPPRILGRADVIALANLASDAYASGMPLPEEATRLTGRRFEIALPFGCDGMSPEKSNGPLRWHYDSVKETLRISAVPLSWTGVEWGFADPEMAETRFRGFWISRPWTSAEICSQTHSASIESPLAMAEEHGLAIAEVTSGDLDAREQRPYEIVTRVTAQNLAVAQGFRLRLMGRLDRFRGDGAITCKQAEGVERRPVCLVVISLDEVRIENSLKNEVLATWRKSSGSLSDGTRSM